MANETAAGVVAVVVVDRLNCGHELTEWHAIWTAASGTNAELSASSTDRLKPAVIDEDVGGEETEKLANDAFNSMAASLTKTQTKIHH